VALALLVIPGEGGGRPAAAAPLTPFRDCAALAGWFRAAASVELSGTGGVPVATDRGLATRQFGAPLRERVAGAAAAAEVAATDLAAGAEGPGATGTNVAEAGVDEPALLKAAGERVVSVWENQLQVTDVSGTPRLRGSLTLPRGAASELVLVGDRALVLGTAWSISPLLERDIMPGSRPLQPVLPESTTAVLTVVDLGDPDRPRVLRTEEIEGTYLSAREHDGVVRVVLQSQPMPHFALPPRPLSSADAAGSDWLPRRIERDGSGDVLATAALLDCTAVSHPSEPAGMGLLTVLTIDLTDPEAPVTDRTGVAAGDDVVYASTERLVVATTAAAMTASGGARTELHGFDLTKRTATPYVGSGEVPGWILGRWALSAHDGFLRVASTRDADAAGTDSVVTVLAEVNEGYRTVGSVGGLGRGEQVRAVRWFGDVATVVTFRQTDPLFTLDLSDPRAPRVLGELKVPGYSAYLHPLGDGLLLGVGQDATLQGEVLGTQVSTFDLRDLTAPALLDAIVAARSWSDVESDARQFTYLPGRRLAVLPIAGEDGSSLWAVQVGVDGKLTTAGRWAPGPQAWLVHAVPVGDDRVVVLSQQESGSRLSVLALDGLDPRGAVTLA
jgi:uncharacterized secreted protein with C-terminal beta-propeller domain